MLLMTKSALNHHLLQNCMTLERFHAIEYDLQTKKKKKNSLAYFFQVVNY